MRRARQARFLLPLALTVLLACPSSAQDLPGVRIEDGRLAVGGDAQQPPAAPEQICLAWTWTPPEGAVEIYPGSEAGTFGKIERTWSLAADGTTVSPETCRDAGAKTPFPEIGVGPADELWLLKSPASPGERRGGEEALAGAWADLLHAVEAAYRHSSPQGDAPLAEIAVGSYGTCEIRSIPVDLETALDRWLPVELPVTPEGDEREAGDQVRVRRFLWWMEGASSEKSCLTGKAATLRLFLIPSEGSDSDSPLLTVAGVVWNRLPFAELDPDDWSPRVRSVRAVEPPAGVTAELTPAQEDQLSKSTLTDLCQVRGIDALCRRNEAARRQLFTAVHDAETGVPWPTVRLNAVQQACRTVLASRTPADACTAASQWRTAVAGGLVADFKGDFVVSQEPRVVETWKGGKIVWQVEEPKDLASVAELRFDLLDGTSVTVDAAALRAAARGSTAPMDWIFPVLAVLAVVLSVLALLRARRPVPRKIDPARKDLLRLVDRAVERRLRDLPAAQGRTSEDEALRSVVHDAVQLLEARAAELEAGLEAHVRALQSSPLDPPPKGAAALQALCRDVEALDAEHRGRITDALAAAGELGYWIELLWPVLQEAAESHLDAIPGNLSPPAAEEWRRARETLEDFAAHDAPAVRWLLRRLSKDECGPSTETVFLESSGLLDSEPPFPERLKRYLTPFDHPGRLGQVSLALQYLVEAYPVEQLEPARRTRLHKGLAQAVKSLRLEEDFHRLLQRVAAGVGLVYQPVPYYKSRLDQSEYAFVRQQVSPISLTDRVGFAAATDPAVIVRLERPFFVQSTNSVYYAGHAHVARG